MSTDTREHPLVTFHDVTQGITCDTDTNPAQWLMLCRGCDNTAYLCGEHKAAFLRRMRRNDVLKCDCGRNAITRKWGQVVEAVRL